MARLVRGHGPERIAGPEDLQNDLLARGVALNTFTRPLTMVTKKSDGSPSLNTRSPRSYARTRDTAAMRARSSGANRRNRVVRLMASSRGTDTARL